MIRRRPWRARHRSTRQTGGSPRRALGSAPSKLRECPPPNLRDPHARDFHRASGAYRVVTHYYSHLSVATLRLDSGTLRVGDVIHIRGMRSRAFRLITTETPVGLFARRKTYDRLARCVLMVRKNRHTPHPFAARSRAAIAITAPDICSRSAYLESCGSARQVACYRSPAAWCDALAASANPFLSSVFSVRASPRIKAVRDTLSFKRRSRPECRMPLPLRPCCRSA